MANVIRGSKRSASAPTGDKDAQARAHGILEEAQLAAAVIIDEAKTAAEQVIAEAAAAGEQEGMKQAEQLRSEIAQMEQRMLDEVTGEVIRTALKIAEELLRSDLSTRSDAIVDMAVASLAVARDAREVFLRVHPANAQVLRAQKKRLIDALSMAKHLDVREDRKVDRGGILIQTDSGVIDAQLETQLAEIARVLGQ